MAAPGVEKVFDELIAEASNWNLTTRSYPEISEEATGDTYQTLPLMPLNQSSKGISQFIDFASGWDFPENFNYEDWEAAYKDTTGTIALGRLPIVMRSKAPLPEGTVVQHVVEKVDVAGVWKGISIKHILLPNKMLGKKVLEYCAGQAYQVIHRPNAFGAKKAFQKMFTNIRGWRSFYQILSVPEADVEMSSSASSSKWNPSPEQLETGIKFINKHAPVGILQNEQFVWIHTEIRRHGSPIHGWPKAEVKEACANKAKGNNQADTENFFPLLVLFDFKEPLSKGVTPLIAQSLLTHGLIICGRAGVGKTQYAKALAMVLGRRWVKVWGLRREAGWRRGVVFDVFRETPGEIHIGILLDDPSPGMGYIDVETLKQFLDVGENTQCDCRYKPVKFTRNQFRAILSNCWNADAEPMFSWMSVTEKDLLAMMEPALIGATGEHQAAVLKRSVVIVAGRRGVYVRLPSEKLGQTVYKFTDDNVGEDWLLPTNKAYLNKYRQGLFEEYEGFQERAEEELELVDSMCREVQQADPENHQTQVKEESLSPSPPREVFGVIDVPDSEEEIINEIQYQLDRESGDEGVEADADVALGGDSLHDCRSSRLPQKRKIDHNLASDEEGIDLVEELHVGDTSPFGERNGVDEGMSEHSGDS